MSIWSSIEGNDPTIYDGGYGEEVLPEAWFDVALSTFNDNRYRIMLYGEEGATRISLDDVGLAELHRRIVIARDRAKK